MTLLPDPTIDLDWSGYVGSIQWHFSEVTKKYPHRICVVETKSSEASERRFNYRQIFEASNVVAHYLHDAGITNGEVVMIWAHRSVELVVSIMGVLAAGATVSILDPAYPPIRQKVYLEIARPRAMINIAKATDEGGPLAPLVRSYIDTELQLKAEAPSLRLCDDGVLVGGERGGKDVFFRARTKASSPPDTQVGPDSVPTLSFTSGSEGRPKAVAGRHFSLTKYFGWMAERFQLSPQSRFTMLSGIAHDPIQRDIFTPLYLGAQLLVPAKEDIQHEKLAEWMREYKPTVTHLTPAMGQILVGGATAEFPSLDRAFFVGDVLTTRDCRHLRRLAVNANIVNMYGTTETQRAVSYYEVPSCSKDPHYLEKLKDTVPAGIGMKNVQLLVVNRQDRMKLCEVGEAGEIYVRAAGLAEGYIGDQALNDQKFLMNWFVNNKSWMTADKHSSKGEIWRKHYKGPRDRLYRTGDLGKYLESGDVECVGRVDDQIKIRGFRIELNDIDSNLGQNLLVRDCKTLVRRDRNEEPTLVSYIVPEFKEWPDWLKARKLEDVDEAGTDFGPIKVYFKKFRRIQTEMRDHLKDRLPSYAVPTIFIVLDKLPLNPNGKIDKPNLPFPDIAERTEKISDEDLERWKSLTETERLVATKWADRIQGVNAKTILAENNFFDVGGHSMAAQQMLLDIRRELGISVSIDMLFKHPTLAGFSAKVDRQQRPKDAVNGDDGEIAGKDYDYSQSLRELLKQLSPTFQTADPAMVRASSGPTIFLTGATGFLGSYIVKDILERTSRTVNLIALVRGVKDSEAALDRLRRSLQGYGLWHDDWSARLTCVIGDLSKPQLGIEQRTWQILAQQADVVIHNGAIVHWVRRYQDLIDSNVISTIDAMKLCNEGKPKIFTFVSSTSVLDTDYYVKLSEKQVGTDENTVPEEDDLEGSRTGLGTGYGQTKWVSEKLVREAGRRGLCGSIIRPGYILGDSKTGICNTDDFLIRMLKGCIQLSARPRIVNTVNSVPVNHAARVVVAAAFGPLTNGVHVVHVTGHPRLRMNEYLSALEFYGYRVPEVSYDAWKEELEKYVSAGSQEKDQEQHALMPLFHFCINDLPATTRAPELDDRNAISVLKEDAKDWTEVGESGGSGITREDVGRFLRYLVMTKFVSPPSGRVTPLPEINLDVTEMQAIGAVGGRGGPPQS